MDGTGQQQQRNSYTSKEFTSLGAIPIPTSSHYRVTHLLAEKVMLTSVPTHTEVL